MRVGPQGICRLKNARFSISIIPLKVSPSENAASAWATTCVCAASKRPCWKTRRTIGWASTAIATDDGTSRKAICRSAVASVRR